MVLEIKENIINDEKANNIINFLDSKEWSTILSRRTQQYGFRYDYIHKTLTKCEPIPDILLKLCELLPMKVDQIIVNEYKDKQGIGRHTDHTTLFGNTICIISLLEKTNMVFRKQNKKREYTLNPNSLLLIKDKARYDWTHELKFNGKRRISITFRSVN